MKHERRILADLDAVSHAAADIFVACVQACVDAGRPCRVAMAGGSTPRRLYQLLANEPYRNHVAWNDVHVFWGDERCVPIDHPASNYRMTHEQLLDHVNIPLHNIHRMTDDAAHNDALIREQFGLGAGEWPTFDLMLLGLGADGHTLSLFPGSDVMHDDTSLVVATHDPMNQRRMTMTIPVLNHAKQLVWLVAGAEKADAVNAVFAGSGALPPHRVAMVHGQSRWLIDAAAGEHVIPAKAGIQ